ncbi:unnamed protein product [Lupinus luteus]|uniref:Plastid lipid-associated protein/fibrillin conserved domain-containing protein n=1 Tax=Lupinus luteus TaxID=3873 RepID=A0AAV1WAV3_LUPLU
MDAPMVDNFVFLSQTNTIKTKPPDKPPDNGNVVPSDGIKVSFLDKMLADRQPAPVREDIDFLAEGLAINTADLPESVSNDLHGEWLVVYRKKRNGRTNKGVTGKVVMVPKVTFNDNHFATLNNGGKHIKGPNVQGGVNPTSSSSLGQFAWSRPNQQQLDVGIHYPHGSDKPNLPTEAQLGGNDPSVCVSANLQSSNDSSHVDLSVQGAGVKNATTPQGDSSHVNKLVSEGKGAYTRAGLDVKEGSHQDHEDGDNSMDCH